MTSGFLGIGKGAGAVLIRYQAKRDVCRRQTVRDALRPFKQDKDAGILKRFRHADLVEVLPSSEPVRIDVQEFPEREPFWERIGFCEHEGGARDGLRYSKRARYGLRERRLPCAELARERHERRARFLRQP